VERAELEARVGGLERINRTRVEWEGLIRESIAAIAPVLVKAPAKEIRRAPPADSATPPGFGKIVANNGG
jgi:hypothetical protein